MLDSRMSSSDIQDFTLEFTARELNISTVAEISPLKGKQLQLRTQRHKLVKTVRKRKTSAVSSQKLQALDRVQDSIRTPTGLLKQKLSTDDVTVTRSGRRSLPPLNRWSGQGYRRIPSSDIERSLKMICNSPLSKRYQFPADSVTNVIDHKLNQTVDVLPNIDECWPVASAGASRKKALVTCSKISLKVNGVPSSADEDTRQGISHTVNKSAERVAATADPHFQLTLNKNSRSHNLTNMSEPSPADNGPGGMLGTVKQSARHSRGLLTRDGTDVHTETTLYKSLRVILSRILPGDVNTQAQKFTKQTRRPLNTEHGSRPVRRSGRGVHKYSSTSSSNVDSDSAFLQSADISQTGVNNKSYSQRVRETRTNQRLPAGNRDSRFRESSNSGSSERNFHRQKQVAAKTRSKKTQVRRLPAGGRSVSSGRKLDNRPLSEFGRKSDSRPLSESGRKGLQAVMTPTVTAAGTGKSRHLTTCSRTAAGQRQPVSTRTRQRDADDDVLQGAAGQRQPVSTTRTRQRDADDDVLQGAAGQRQPVSTTRTRQRDVLQGAAGQRQPVTTRTRQRDADDDVLQGAAGQRQPVSTTRTRQRDVLQGAAGQRQPVSTTRTRQRDADDDVLQGAAGQRQPVSTTRTRQRDVLQGAAGQRQPVTTRTRQRDADDDVLQGAAGQRQPVSTTRTRQRDVLQGAAGQRQPVSTTRTRQRDADDDVLQGAAGQRQIVSTTRTRQRDADDDVLQGAAGQRQPVSTTRTRQRDVLQGAAGQRQPVSTTRTRQRDADDDVLQGAAGQRQPVSTTRTRQRDVLQGAAGQRQPVSTTRTRQRDADGDVLQDDMKGNNTIMDRKSRKRRKVMGVTLSGDVSSSQQKKDLLHGFESMNEHDSGGRAEEDGPELPEIKRRKDSGQCFCAIQRELNESHQPRRSVLPNLTPEIWIKIFSYITSDGQYPFMIRVPLVCKEWYNLCRSLYLWTTVRIPYCDCYWMSPTDDFLIWLAKNRLAHCKEIDLTGWGITSRGIKVLADSCPKLQVLNVSHCTKLDRDVAAYFTASCPYITTLDFSHTSTDLVSDIPMTTIVKCYNAQLLSLNLSNNEVHGFREILDAICDYCPNLELLSIKRCLLDCLLLDIERLQRSLPHLRTLNMGFTHYGYLAIEERPSYPSPGFQSLEDLSIAVCSCGLPVNDDFIERMVMSSRRLKSLDLRGAENFSVKTLLKLPCHDLEKLFMGIGVIDDPRGLVKLLTQRRHSLVEIILSNSSFSLVDITQAVLCLVKGENQVLERIELESLGIDLSLVKAICYNCPNLKTINLQNCLSIPEKLRRVFDRHNMSTFRNIVRYA